MSKSVSVILCTYNGEAYLAQQLRSIAEQTVLPAELIVQDDGSTDRTLEIAEAFSQQSAFPVTVHRNSVNLGFADNFLVAAEKAKYPYLAFSDQDDVWLPHKLGTCLAAFSNPEVKAVIHSAKLISRDGLALGGRYPAYGGRSTVTIPMDPWHAPPGFAMMCTRDLVTDFDWHDRPAGHMDPKRRPKPHDQWLFMLGTAVGKVALLGDDLALYRQHGANAAGAPASTLGGQFKDAAGAGADVYRDKAGFAQENSDCLLRLSETGLQHAAALRRAAEFYLQVSLAEARRAALYEATGPISKLKLLARDLSAADYKSRSSGGFGLKSLAKDLVSVLR